MNFKGHIYGPGDAMIAIIIEMRKSGDLPMRVGQGINDYIYVDNLVDAHLEAVSGGSSSGGSGGSGSKQYSITSISFPTVCMCETCHANAIRRLQACR